MKREAKRNRKKLGEHVCKVCNKCWPSVAPFFAIHKKSKTTGTQVYIGRICKLCRNERRRQNR